jgi:glucosamine--fructose-6-phosphate aminotransferase (isomerizing)
MTEGAIRPGGVIEREVAEGPAAIRATLRDARDAAAGAAGLLESRDVRRVFVIGNGTSRHSALAAAALYSRHAGPNDPVVLPLTAGEFVTYGPALGDRDALVGISASGEFGDVVAAVTALRGTVPTVGIVHVGGSSLTNVADRVVVSSGGPSNVPVMTKTFSSTLVAAEMTLLGLLGDRADAILAEIGSAADDAEAAISAAAPVASVLAAELERYRHVFVVGAGLAHVAALEAALKLKEVALVHAEGTETWEMTSGAATMIDATTAVVALAPTGPGREPTAELVRHVAGWGAATLEVGPERVVPTSLLLELPRAASEDHAPLTAVPPVVLVADALARARGLDPDRPGWVERYHSQGLRHIVGVEASA